MNWRLSMLGFCGLLSACGAAPADPGMDSDGEATDDCAGRGSALKVPFGAQFEGGALSLEVIVAEPSEPALGDNHWTLQLSREEGAVEGAALYVLPWMTDHQHASLKAPVVDEMAGGRYAIGPVHFQMPGYWELRFEVEQAGAVERALVELCLSE